MAITLENVLKAIDAVGVLAQHIPAVADLIETGIAALKNDEQDIAKDHYAQMRARNDALHDLVQQKLEFASKR